MEAARAMINSDRIHIVRMTKTEKNLVVKERKKLREIDIVRTEASPLSLTMFSNVKPWIPAIWD
jgi:hypothetical protein